MKKSKKVKQAVFTVESAFLVPLAMMILASVLTLLFYTHNRNWYLAAAGEVCLVGNADITSAEGAASGTGTSDEEERASERAGQKIREQTLPGSAPQAEVQVNDWGTTAGFSGQQFEKVAFGTFMWEESVSVQKVRPVSFLQKKWIISAY